MHVDFAGGASPRRGTPREFFLGSSLRQGDELAGDVAPLSVIALPEAFGSGLREQGARDAKRAEQKQHESSSHDEALLHDRVSCRIPMRRDEPILVWKAQA